MALSFCRSHDMGFVFFVVVCFFVDQALLKSIFLLGVGYEDKGRDDLIHEDQRHGERRTARR